MKLKNTEEKKAVNLLKAMIHYYFGNEQREMSYEDKPYMNFLAYIGKHVSFSEFYDSDLMEITLDRYLSELKAVPNQIVISDFNSLAERIIRTFEINVGEHYIVIPIPKAGLDQVIQFDKFSLIPRELSRCEKIKVISEITSIEIKELENGFQHTENSRSPDFMKHIIVNQNKQSNFLC